MVMVRLDQKNGSVQRRLIVPALLIAATACGCKSSSWMARPSWLGGSPPPSSLSSAPAFDKGVAKPSQTSKPYPTTSTPGSYVLNNQTRTDTPRATTTAAAPSTVTYGAAPPSTTAPAAPIAPQVGPYASIQQAGSSAPPNDPATAVTSGFAASPSFGGSMTPPAPATPPTGSRFASADNSSAGWTPPPPAQPSSPPMAPVAAPIAPPTQPVPTDSHYGTAGSSRFSGGSDFPPAASAAPPQAPQFSAPPATAAPLIEPASTPPASALPGTMTPPARRPDPGYRPGGTSSYRPAKTLLADDEQDPGVQPASFAAP